MSIYSEDTVDSVRGAMELMVVLARDDSRGMTAPAYVGKVRDTAFAM